MMDVFTACERPGPGMGGQGQSGGPEKLKEKVRRQLPPVGLDRRASRAS